MPRSNKPFCHTMGTPVTATLGGESGLVLVHAVIWGRCWEEIHDAEARECHPGCKSYAKPGRPSHQAGFLGLCESWGWRNARRTRCPTRSWRKASANSSWQGETSEEDAGRLPADGCRTRVPRGSQSSGDGGCGGVCALRAHVATLPRVFNPESRADSAAALL